MKVIFVLLFNSRNQAAVFKRSNIINRKRLQWERKINFNHIALNSPQPSHLNSTREEGNSLWLGNVSDRVNTCGRRDKLGWFSHLLTAWFHYTGASPVGGNAHREERKKRMAGRTGSDNIQEECVCYS